MEINGVKVIDAKRPIKLLITPDDVKNGRTKKPDCCAAAVACRRQIKGVLSAFVHISRVYLRVRHNGKNKWLRYMTSRALRTEVIAFDKGGAFSPGEYTIATVQPSTRFGTKKRKRYDNSKGPRHGKPSKRSKRHFVDNIRMSPFNPSLSQSMRMRRELNGHGEPSLSQSH